MSSCISRLSPSPPLGDISHHCIQTAVLAILWAFLHRCWIYKRARPSPTSGQATPPTSRGGRASLEMKNLIFAFFLLWQKIFPPVHQYAGEMLHAAERVCLATITTQLSTALFSLTGCVVHVFMTVTRNWSFDRKQNQFLLKSYKKTQISILCPFVQD